MTVYMWEWADTVEYLITIPVAFTAVMRSGSFVASAHLTELQAIAVSINGRPPFQCHKTGTNGTRLIVEVEY